MNILVINAGSSSLKYQLIDMNGEKVLAKGLCDRIGLSGSVIKHKTHDGRAIEKEIVMSNHLDAIKQLIAVLTDEQVGVIKSLDEINAVGHRVVHGGEKFFSSVVINDEVLKTIEECEELAPLHNPPNVTGIKACTEIMKGVPQVAVFDTAFHQTMPKKAYIYALPYEYYEKYKLRKYGFHGTSHKYVSERAAVLLNKPYDQLKIVTCHLGNGSSITAVDCGKSVETSMGFTPLDGLAMGTRCGTIDPAAVTFLMNKEKLTTEQMDEIMNKKSGVYGISGVSSDFRDLDDAVEKGNERAELALQIFAYQVKKYIGAYACAMGGLDAVVFTAGIGENNPGIRQRICSNLEFLGIKIDPEKNKIRGAEIDISAEGAKVRTLVIPTNEELAIAKETIRLIGR
ncbi:acetate/propionate family kinase [Thermoclostridium caenicola]|uniref:Acetate kinase n=1 Tax=Thermoclostridium caenicola TaxID=659425 RepID=A0A1M6EXA3_9FIRM|nr:acetate kinase [Thermoclostridium caenicola]SHI90043.1 acetate kinase [Thermoclostridium caenicola]